MYKFKNIQTFIGTWQFLFIVSALSWLWAPILNHTLTNGIALISHYETAAEDFAWLFRLGDITSGLLLFYATIKLNKLKHLNPLLTWLLFAVAATMIIDPLITTSCIFRQGICIDNINYRFLAHTVESLAGAISIFLLVSYDALVRRNFISTSFAIFQFFYGILLLSEISTPGQTSSVSQFMYQSMIILWLAWFIRECFESHTQAPLVKEKQLHTVRLVFAIWAALNGLLAIIFSLVHVRLLSLINGLFIANDTAWLAQHGVVSGVTLLYISRHLQRGEKRARQIFLFVAGLEVIKYSVLRPQPVLLALYLTSFAILFIFKHAFNRGTARPNWSGRLWDILIIAFGVSTAVIATWLIFFRSGIRAKIANRTISHFSDLAFRVDHVTRFQRQSALLAHTIAALLIATLWFILWSIFRPGTLIEDENNDDIELVYDILNRYSKSPEDYFKLWPNDKKYFWNQNHEGFIAYKVVGPVAFALADPIAANELEIRNLIINFTNYCRAHGWRVCVLLIDDTSIGLYKELNLNSLQIGASAEVSISNFMDNTINDKWWRWQRNKSKKLEYIYSKHLPAHSRELLDELKLVSDAWLTRDGRREQTFALGYFNDEYLQQCTIHIVKDNEGKIIAFANEIPNLNNSHISTVDMIRFIPETNHTMPFLIQNIISGKAEVEGQVIFDLGFVPLAKMHNKMTKFVKVLGSQRFSASGLEQFKSKFDPNWRSEYIAYDGDFADLALAAAYLEKAMEKG